MKEQVMKSLTMLLLVVALAFVTGVASANGQSRAQLNANIPFDFVVGDKTMTAGQYNVSGLFTSGDVICVKDNKGKSAVRLSNTLISSKPQKNSKLVFHRYGDRYFLAEIWSAGETNGRQLLRSDAEAAIKRELTAVYRSRGNNQSVYERVELLAVVTHD